jgi:hypothetical protein
MQTTPAVSRPSSPLPASSQRTALLGPIKAAGRTTMALAEAQF